MKQKSKGPDHESEGHEHAAQAHGTQSVEPIQWDWARWPQGPMPDGHGAHGNMSFTELERFHIPREIIDRIGAVSHKVEISESVGHVKVRDIHDFHTAHAEGTVRVTNPTFPVIIRFLLSHPRKNEAVLTPAEKSDFNQAVSMAIDAGMYEWMVGIHAGPYMMHSFMGVDGMLRFLPWHRVYMYRMELLLRFYVPGVAIPYWDWTNNPQLPSWVMLPSGITRGPDARVGPIGTQSELNNSVMSQTDYVSFTSRLERSPFHNRVHGWVGGNTMPFPSVSPRDPLFWLHHANVDRIWSQWQDQRQRPGPPLSGPERAMYPWYNYDVDVTRDTLQLWYYYQ